MSGDLWSSLRWTERDQAKAGRSRGRRASGSVEPDEPDPEGWRSRYQQDYDRLLFSTPVRRLSDKTQVWPMDENDGVRTRLTHSHEVANLARSIGSRIASTTSDIFGDVGLHEVVQPILSAIGLAHDLGNPPFGHQGEAAIARWFKQREQWIFSKEKPDGEGLPISIPPHLRPEFTEFDGNPQSLRLIAKLQTSATYSGLNLTAATLAASLKYPVSSANRRKDDPVCKKVGYFESERALVEWVRSETGLQEKQRHPLTWIMEACDDIAYSVLDVDDVMKKGLVSPDDVRAILRSTAPVAALPVMDTIDRSFEKVKPNERPPEVVRDIKIGYVRAHLIEALIKEASAAFVAGAPAIMRLEHRTPLMDGSPLCDCLKGIAKQHAFNNTGVLKMEALGAAAIDELMSAFWDAISNRRDFENLRSQRSSARSKYAFALISPNYIEDAVRSIDPGGAEGGVRYRELRLLTDMVSGMTDTFALKLWQDLKRVPDVGGGN